MTRMYRAWESHHSPRHLFICALTANSYAEHVGQCIDAGMDAFLVKPLRFEMRAAPQRPGCRNVRGCRCPHRGGGGTTQA